MMKTETIKPKMWNFARVYFFSFRAEDHKFSVNNNCWLAIVLPKAPYKLQHNYHRRKWICGWCPVTQNLVDLNYIICVIWFFVEFTNIAVWLRSDTVRLGLSAFSHKNRCIKLTLCRICILDDCLICLIFLIGSKCITITNVIWTTAYVDAGDYIVDDENNSIERNLTQSTAINLCLLLLWFLLLFEHLGKTLRLISDIKTTRRGIGTIYKKQITNVNNETSCLDALMPTKCRKTYEMGWANHRRRRHRVTELCM